MWFSYLDTYTQRSIQKIHEQANSFTIPPKTDYHKHLRPLLFSIYEIPEYGSRCLVMYDVAGEIYYSLDDVEKYVTPIKQVTTIWFMVSLPDLKDDSQGRTIRDLFEAYLSGMKKLKESLQGKNLIVIYTKGDKSLEIEEFSEYLSSDPLQNLTSENAGITSYKDFPIKYYIEKMEQVSNDLKNYTCQAVEGGEAFINMVEKNGMNLVFCTTSALGQDPDQNNRLRNEAQRLRVLDPFLWAISLESKISCYETWIIIDTSANNQYFLDNDLFVKLWEELSEYSPIKFFFLGNTKPVSQPGECPSIELPKVSTCRLIGPILDLTESIHDLIIICNDPVIDLEDFNITEWKKHSLIVKAEDNNDQNEKDDPWTEIIFHEGDDIKIIVDRFLSIKNER